MGTHRPRQHAQARSELNAASALPTAVPASSAGDEPKRPDLVRTGQSRDAFYGRRKGHRLRAGQARLFESLLPRLALDLISPAPKLSALFSVPVDSIRLEIGFGGGEHLIRQAQANRHVGFIGCEPFVNGMAKVLAAIEAFDVANVRLHQGDGTKLLAWFPAASLERVELLYPDPWPKRRHWKRRFIQPSTVAAIVRVLRPGGEFRFVTDWPDYAAWTLERLMHVSELAWTAEHADDWRKPWSDFSSTRYEAKALREGRVPCYLTFRRE